ncbi:hypothetical protein [Frankia sp. AgKG'84/4]|uniref:hypothetical protein n=1 Tax=Frankia sp. AgKG'84/4 TaxID=573490 RepID=UPI00200BF909|nr:hypothetical protein [Frankia sp. AgKG'84/4]
MDKFEISSNALEIAISGSPGDWVVAETNGAKYTIGSLLPNSFLAYARVFHPVYLGDQEVKWAKVAHRNGTVAHPLMQWESITGSWRYSRGDTQHDVWDECPSVGSLPVSQAKRLAHLLARHTSTVDECWFAVWSGFGGLEARWGHAPRVAMPRREMMLLSGPLPAAARSVEDSPGDQRANLWWPDDQAWCLVTDIDLMTTYVGGSPECIASITTDSALEAMPVLVDQGITLDSDKVNPQPSGSYNDAG